MENTNTKKNKKVRFRFIKEIIHRYSKNKMAVVASSSLFCLHWWLSLQTTLHRNGTTIRIFPGV